MLSLMPAISVFRARLWQLKAAAIAFTALALSAAVPAAADSVNVAVAANFTAAMKLLAPLFEQASGHTLVVSYGATGKLYAQIRHGAPFDVLLAADDTTAARLVAASLGEPDSPFVYATGRLVLWGMQPGEHYARALRDPPRLAIANPKTSPYGQAAIETLAALGRLKALRPRFVTGENIAQTQQFVASGNAPLGFIALAQVEALSPEQRGHYWEVPAALHQPIDQSALLLRRAASSNAARAFLDFLRSEEAVAIIRKLGYEVNAAGGSASAPRQVRPNSGQPHSDYLHSD